MVKNTIKERLAVIETQLKACQRNLWIVMAIVAGKAGAESWPHIVNLLSSLI